MPDDSPRLVGVIVTIIIVFVILFLGVFVGNQLATTSVSGPFDRGDAVLLQGTGNWVTIADEIGQDETVYNSRGYAINLTGASDSYFESTQDVTISSDDTWTLAIAAHVDSASSGETMTAVSLDGRAVIAYNGSQSKWVGWYYDEGGPDTYEVSVDAPNQPGTFSKLVLKSDGSSLTLNRDDAATNSTALSGSSVASAPVETSNWDGRMDELRTADDAWSSSTVSAWMNDPIDPQPGTDRTARAMFDQPDKATQLLFYTDADLSTSNATYTEGLPGQELDSASQFLTSDYEWDQQGPRIRPLQGGELDGAPVAYVDYETTSELDTFADDWGEAIKFAALVPIVAVLYVVVIHLRGLRRGRT